MMNLKPKYRLLVSILVMTLLHSCSVKKFIPEGESLFRGGEVTVNDTVKIENKSDLEDELQSLYFPEPNTRFLGMYPGLYYYYKAQKDKPGFIVRYMNKKIGEKPVYYSDFKKDVTADLMENRLQNNGFFQSEIRSTTQEDTNKKTIFVDYNIVIGKPYELANYVLEVDSLEKLDSFPIYDELRTALTGTVLKKGSRYSLGALKYERERIDVYLKQMGYYNFNSNFLLFQADTNLGNNKTFNLYLKIKEGVPAKAKVPYVVKKIEVVHNVAHDSIVERYDSIVVEDITFIQDEIIFIPKRLRPYIIINEGERYDPVASKYTSRRISSIGTYKFVNIDYDEVDSLGSDSMKVRYLNAKISLSPLTKRALQSELKGVTKSNNFTGPSLGATYLNRNIFKGGENFSLSGNIGYEVQFGNQTSGSTNFQWGVNSSLSFPRLIFPGNLDQFFKYSVPKTKLSVGYDFFRRSNLYSLHSYSTSIGYTWDPNRHLSHHLNPVDITYLQLTRTSDLFDEILEENPFLKRSFEQQFIAGLTYSVFYNNLDFTRNRGRFNIKFNFDMAGNALDLISNKKGADTVKTFLGLAYAQYVKADIDFSYHYALNNRGKSIVGRVFGGVGVPYGNSQSLPYVKQYFSGGSYSVRAFPIRGLGPGVYDPETDENLNFDRSGDIRLEANLEYRFPIISYLKGALFADAGNIWNLTDEVEGGQFTSDYINQFGVGTGFGIRVDIQGFVIRFDLAAPLKQPAGTWDFEYKKTVFNFAIGYPF